jgi:hypothetical protein
VGGIRLVADQEEMAIIPESATDDHLKQINMDLKTGYLVLGWPEDKKVEVPERDSDLKALLEAGRNKVDDWIYSLKIDKTIRSIVKTEKLEKLIEFERAGKNRKSVITTAENALKNIGGISKVEETDKDVVEIKLTSGNTEMPEEK